MDAVFETGAAKGWPEDALSREYFSVPEQPDYENHPFVLKLARSGKTIAVPADITAAEALNENGIHIDVKCSDGLCGVCVQDYLSGEVEHRDFLLSGTDRQTRMATCCSRAKSKDGIIELDI